MLHEVLFSGTNCHLAKVVMNCHKHDTARGINERHVAGTMGSIVESQKVGSIVAGSCRLGVEVRFGDSCRESSRFNESVVNDAVGL